MDLRVLLRGADPTHEIYRGLERPGPVYFSELPDDAEVNQLFYWYSEEGGESGIVHDITKAQRLLFTSRDACPAVTLDLVDVVFGDSRSSISDATLLGYDICVGYYLSLIHSGIMSGSDESSYQRWLSSLGTAAPLVRLVKEHFSQRLNRRGLFDSYRDAAFCLDCMIAMQAVRRDLWESTDNVLDARVLGVWLVAWI